MIVSKYAFFDVLAEYNTPELQVDISRVAAGIIAGMGIFSGGIVFIGKRGNVSGVTTAAGIWATIGIGMVIGAGMYVVGIGGVILVELIQLLLRHDLPVYRRNIKAVNPSADIVFEDANGEINEIFEEDLPYDLKSEELVLDTNAYGIFYLDAMDHLERYVGKRIVFQALCMTPPDFPKGYFIPGRMAMTCCAQDMAFLGYACKYGEGQQQVKDKDWVVVTATVKQEFFPEYGGEGPVLYAEKIEKSKEPKDAVVSFTA